MVNYRNSSRWLKNEPQGNEVQNSNEVISLDPTPNEALTSHQLVITKAGDHEVCKEAIEVTLEEEWVARSQTM